MKNRATAQMVAAQAEVSRAAVSRAFTPGSPISAEKRARVLEVARKLNYVPDHAASTLKTRRSRLVGLIVPDACSPWEAQEIDALTSALQEQGFGCVLFKTRSDMKLDELTLRNMRAFNPDSIIVFPEAIRPGQLAPYLDRAVPIYIDHLLPHPGESALPHDRLEVDLRPGMSQAVALLTGYQPKRIAYIAGRAGTEAEHARRGMLTTLLKERGLPPPVVVEGDFSYASGHAAALDLFRVHGGADAIFAVNDESAFGALDAIRQDLGLSIPRDVKLVGFDDIPQAGWGSYRLTTIRVDLNERVRMLVRLILMRLNDPDASPLSDRIATSLIVRDTVG